MACSAAAAAALVARLAPEGQPLPALHEAIELCDEVKVGLDNCRTLGEAGAIAACVALLRGAAADVKAAAAEVLHLLAPLYAAECCKSGAVELLVGLQPECKEARAALRGVAAANVAAMAAVVEAGGMESLVELFRDDDGLTDPEHDDGMDDDMRTPRQRYRDEIKAKVEEFKKNA
ncbi:hypothetical protein AB1Y20_002137 [Prymnesium parvum]|uniref:Armadillo repeat-containing protein 1 n=1 Tax=Prymnesium parvum TaxID=97485 RepID=A0AB34J9I6_PRYPA|mmetsp:Transcript_11316/g.27981  ORF Transcript_11316/g.27981 Transcript_11316/m.27981 type:complete len:176 (+) Transcript_11316:38-565(+)